jgi:hypothetical protein
VKFFISNDTDNTYLKLPQATMFHFTDGRFSCSQIYIVAYGTFCGQTPEQGRSVTMGQPGQSEQLAPPVHKNLQNKNAKLY